MAINWSNPRPWNKPASFDPDLSAQVFPPDGNGRFNGIGALHRYGSGWSVHPTWGHERLDNTEVLNKHIRDGTLPAGSVQALESAGWDGGELTYQDYTDLLVFESSTGRVWASDVWDPILEGAAAPPLREETISQDMVDHLLRSYAHRDARFAYLREWFRVKAIERSPGSVDGQIEALRTFLENEGLTPVAAVHNTDAKQLWGLHDRYQESLARLQAGRTRIQPDEQVFEAAAQILVAAQEVYAVAVPPSGAGESSSRVTIKPPNFAAHLKAIIEDLEAGLRAQDRDAVLTAVEDAFAYDTLVSQEISDPTIRWPGYAMGRPDLE